MDTIIQSGDSNTIVVNNVPISVISTTDNTTYFISTETAQETTINTSSTVTHTIISSPDQQMQSGTTSNVTAAGLISTDNGNNLTIGTDGRMIQLPKLASTNW